MSTTTGPQMVELSFRESDDDCKRMRIFSNSFCILGYHESYLRPPFRDDVKEWVQANWYRWEEEQPEWWTDAVKGSIPDDMLPAPALKEEEKKGGGSRRRSSLGDIMAVTEGTGGSAEVVPTSS